MFVYFLTNQTLQITNQFIKKKHYGINKIDENYLLYLNTNACLYICYCSSLILARIT